MVTVSPVEPDTLDVAEMVVDPPATPVAIPPALIVALVGALLPHVTLPVQLVAVKLDQLQVAAYCFVPPTVTDELTGDTVMLTNVGAVTVRPVDPLTEPEVAVIVVAPAAIAVASPPAAIVALLVALEDHATAPVQLVVEASDHVQVAVYCSVEPTTFDEPAGVTAMLVRVGGGVTEEVKDA